MAERFPLLTSSAQLGSLTLRNRIVLAAMGSNFAAPDGHCTERLIAYYEARARGGAGLLILETSAACWPNGATMPNTLGFSSDDFLPGLTELTRRVHAQGARIVAQLNHGGKMAQEDTAAGRPIPVPSPVKKSGSDMFKVLTRQEMGNFIKAAGPDGKGPVYQEMSVADIDQIVDGFAAAALRAKNAGFDGVEIHAGHGYLLANFLSPATNTRQDAYGGSRENRARFLVRVIQAIRAEAGEDFPVLVRLDAHEYRIEGGIEIDDCVTTAGLCERAGATALDISAYGNTASGIAFTEAPLVHEPGGFVDFARAVKAAVSIPVIAVGRIEPAQAERSLARQDYDFLAMGRKLLADPELPNKLTNGQAASIRPCIYCYVCVSQIFVNQAMCCAVNTTTGRESEGDILARDSEPENILVIGGGPAGMEAARLLSLRGHQVSLWEKSPDLGGTARVAALAYEPNERLIDYLDAQVRALPIELRLGTCADPQSIIAGNFDRVIVATGARRMAPPIPGKDLDHVFDGDELRGLLFGDNPAALKKLPRWQRYLLGLGRISQLLRHIGLLRLMSRVWMPLADEVVIIGGGLVGLELAEYLAERGRKLTVLEPGPVFGKELAIVRRARVLHLLREAGVNLVKDAEVHSIDPGAVTYQSQGETHQLHTRQVIIALGAQPDDSLESDLAASAAQATPVHRIGDCLEVGYIEGAMLSARELVAGLRAEPADIAVAQPELAAPAREAISSR